MARPRPEPLQECHVISLRPIGGHAGLRRAAARAGARVLALSPWRLQALQDAHAQRQLQLALRCARVVFTSPAAVRAAVRLQPLRARRGQQWFAVGTSTARALASAGVADVAVPTRMDSEGLLSLPGLADVDGVAIGLVTAPDGRDRLLPALRRRGATLVRADVYARTPVTPAPRAVTALCALRTRPWLALSSAGALARILEILPTQARTRLLRARVVAASARLAGEAGKAGFADVVVAASARPRDLIAAVVHARAAPARGQ